MTTQISPGKMIVLEGPDGAGKSTAARHIRRVLEMQGQEVVMCRLPGGTAVGEVIRNFFKENAVYLPIEDQIAMLMLAKRQLVSEVIKPALAAGKSVVCDRFTDSLYAYQWAGFGEFDPQIKRRIDDNLLIYGIDVEPDLKIILDCPVEVSMQRMNDSRALENDVLDQMNKMFKKRIRSYYRHHLKESSHGHTVFVNTVQGVANTLSIVERFINILIFSRLSSPTIIPIEIENGHVLSN